MHCCILTPTTDNNTITGVIRVTRRQEYHELSGNFTRSGEWSPCNTVVRSRLHNRQVSRTTFWSHTQTDIDTLKTIPAFASADGNNKKN